MDKSIIPEPERTLSLRLRAALNTLRIGHYPGGQTEDRDHGFLWSPTDEKDWHRGGDGDLAPNLSRPTTVAIFVGMLVASGWTVRRWEAGTLGVIGPMRDDGAAMFTGAEAVAIAEAFEWAAKDAKRAAR